MSEHINPTEYHAPLAEEPKPSYFSVATCISWLVILGITLFLFCNVLISQIMPAPREQEISGAEIMNINMIGRMLIGQSQMAPATDDSLANQFNQFNLGPIEQRYCYALFVNELEGPEIAIEKIEQTDKAAADFGYELTPDQIRLQEIICHLLDQYQAGNLDSSLIPKDDRDFLTSKLGWCGSLALVPSGTPNQSERQKVINQATSTFWMMVGIFFFAVGLLLSALVSVATLLYLLLSGNIQTKMRTSRQRGSIYLETFAIWISLFIILQLGIGFAGSVITDPMILQILMPTVFFASLFVLIWPALRGIPFREVREDLGLTLGNPLKEITVALVSYTALIPFVLCAGVVSVVLGILLSSLQETNEFSSTTAGGHPIQEEIASGDPTTWLIVFLTACVAAPVVEETMFRGVLFRHLRDATVGWRRYQSIGFAALFNSLIFASIHPQGLVGIPLLTTLAIGFSLMRQWRGSLLASIVMHAINNGLVTCTLFLLMS
ncbi:MAG: CPBP family intramembrane metalloprotease [Mariniblastus sp.]|nr:CPBP family intramembrane metalloprotease [Mariniblastus sp.]